ncbi:phosphoribosyltransferase family protein [Desulfobacterota bacterium M19]
MPRITSDNFPLLHGDKNGYPANIVFQDGAEFPLFSSGIISADKINQQAEQVAAEISACFSRLLIVQVLEGARMFCSRVCFFLDKMKKSYKRAGIKVMSYSGTRAGSRKIVTPLLDDAGRQLDNLAQYDVVVIDDLIDAGNTMVWLMDNYLSLFTPRSISAAFMLEKNRKRSVEVNKFIAANHIIRGKLAADEWLVGFGLDISLEGPDKSIHLFRKLPEVYAFNRGIERRFFKEYNDNPLFFIRQMRSYISED